MVTQQNSNRLHGKDEHSMILALFSVLIASPGDDTLPAAEVI
jgi:hypothetical protein